MVIKEKDKEIWDKVAQIKALKKDLEKFRR